MVKPPCCDKLNVRKGAWVEEKDAPTFAYLSKQKQKQKQHGTTSPWSCITRKTGSKRCGKNSRIRWNNYLRPDLTKEGFTQQEEELVIKLHAAVGSRWGLIAHQLPGRTENEIKNHWNTKLRKKLSEMGIDPITHKPFSQILADYGNIGGISRSSDHPNYIGTITRDLKKVSTFTNTNSNTNTNTLSKPESSTPPSYTFLSNSQLSHTPSMSMSMSMSPVQNNHHNHNAHSLDLLSQLQAISLVTEGPAPTSDTSLPFYNNPDDSYTLPPLKTLSHSPSAYHTNNGGQAAPNSPDLGFSWHDFLLEEPSKPAQSQAPDQLGNNLTEFSSTDHDNKGGGVNPYDIQAASSTSATLDASSFLEAMLHQEDDMFLTFPGLMEEPLY